jgi:peptidyl-prolyl cis-trans isomerase D
LTESAVVTESDIAAVIRLLRQEREVAYALIPAEAFLPKVTVAPQDVERYYQAHAELFRTTEEVRIAYLRLSTQQLLEDYPVGEEELRRLYEQESARFTTPEKRRAAHILIALPPQADEAEAARALAKVQELARQLRAGADFAALARRYSQDPDSAARGGDLGDVRRGMLPRELEQAVFALQPGGVSEPVRSQYGFHLAKLTGHVPEKRQPFEAVRPELVKLVRSRKGVQRFYELSEQLRNLVYEQPDSLEPAAKALGLKIEQSGWFSRAGGRGIAAHHRVVGAAFSTEVLDLRRNSDVIELDADTFVALRILDHRPAELRPLAEVRRDIERRLRQEAARAAAHRLGEELLAALERGVPLAALAPQHGLRYHPPRAITREAGDLDRQIVEAAFRLPRPEGERPRYGMADLGAQGYALLALRRVTDGDPARADTATREQVISLLMQRRGGEYFAYYRARLRAESKVKIYDDRL